MKSDLPKESRAFTLVEIIVSMGVLGFLLAAVVATWTSLFSASADVTVFAERQSDQSRALDYLKRDLRRALTVQVYNEGSLVMGTGSSGNKLVLTVPDYYSDTEEEDNPFAAKAPNTPTYEDDKITYGATLTVEYYAFGGAIYRKEGDTRKTITDSGGAFVLTFSSQSNGSYRVRVFYDQPVGIGGSRTLRRQVDHLCWPRSALW